MPLYDYKCKKVECQLEFEQKVSLAEFDTIVVTCPNCEGEAQRLLKAQRTAHTTWKDWKL